MKTATVLISVIFVFESNSFAYDVESKIVRTDQGPVKGYKSNEGDYFVFYNIPYATAPTGRDKFKAPLPGPKWTEIYEAIDRKVICLQSNVSDTTYQMQEDCLIANIYVPDTNETNVPVVVNVHGGAFRSGYGEKKTPKRIVNEGRYIAVNFNYRLGPIGFLCLGTEAIPGNAGMKDMLALLRWVQRNIANFGGNPNDVTLDGNSSGGSAAELVRLSKTSRGLFHKLTRESGPAISPWGIVIDPLENAKSYAKLLNFTTDDVSELENFYVDIDFQTLISQINMIHPESSTTFVPCVERDTGTEFFLGDAPINILKSGDFEKMPVLVGFTDMEGSYDLEVFDEWKDMMNNKFSDFLPYDLKFASDDEKESVARNVKEFYFGAKNVSEDTYYEYIKYFSDVSTIYPVLRTVKLEVEAGSDSVFLYEYTFADNSSMSSLLLDLPVRIVGAEHNTQTSAILENDGNLDESSYSEEYRQTRASLRELWINFYKTGRPVLETTTLTREGWPPISANDTLIMILDYVSQLQNSFYTKEFQFWNEIYDQYYQIPKVVGAE